MRWDTCKLGTSTRTVGPNWGFFFWTEAAYSARLLVHIIRDKTTTADMLNGIVGRPHIRKLLTPLWKRASTNP